MLSSNIKKYFLLIYLCFLPITVYSNGLDCSSFGELKDEESRYIASHYSENMETKKEIVECSYLTTKNPDLWRYFYFFDVYNNENKDELEHVLTAYKNYSLENQLKFTDGKKYVDYAYYHLMKKYVEVVIDQNEICGDKVFHYIDILDNEYSSSSKDLKLDFMQKKAACFLKQKDYKSSLKEFETMLSQEGLHESGKSYVYMSISKLYALQGNDKFSLDYLDKSIKSYVQIENKKEETRDFLFEQMMGGEFHSVEDTARFKHAINKLLSN